MRMRTILEAHAYLSSVDPETAITKTALRRLVVSGAVPSVKIGNKYLVALETIDDYLRGGQTKGTSAPARGAIRPVEVKA